MEEEHRDPNQSPAENSSSEGVESSSSKGPAAAAEDVFVQVEVPKVSPSLRESVRFWYLGGTSALVVPNMQK